MKYSELLKLIDKERVRKAIEIAEKETSGEIRVHIDDNLKKKDPFDRALEVFYKLKMYKTAARNGVLIYVSAREQKVAVIGDQGINEKVPENFWEDVIQILTDHFKEQKFTDGLEKAILLIGEKLKEFFPYQKDDINELSDDISSGNI